MSSFLYGLGRAAARSRRAVLLAWLAVLVVLGAAAGLLAGEFDEEFSLPGTESQVAWIPSAGPFLRPAGPRRS